MSKMRKKFVVSGVLLCLFLCMLCGCALLKKEQVQQAEEPVTEAEASEEAILIEESTFENMITEDVITADEEKDTFEYVALGNSVTCNVKSDLWWGNWGMAATSPEKDYVHRIAQWLREEKELDVAITVMNIKNWEVASNRNKKKEQYREYFTEETDLVTIQTGENIVNNKEDLEADYTKLLKMIKEQAPNAKILVLGEVLWPSEDIETAKKKACKKCDVIFVKTNSFLKNYDAKFRSSLGTRVKGADGKKHKIENETVAAHPNNAGMRKIADLFIKKLEEMDLE